LTLTLIFNHAAYMNPETRPQSAIVDSTGTVLPLNQLRDVAEAAVSFGNCDCAANVPRSGFLRRLSDHVQAWFDLPFGYEDESGFHYAQSSHWDRDVATERIVTANFLPADQAPKLHP
jgi:hypothetical protein